MIFELAGHWVCTPSATSKSAFRFRLGNGNRRSCYRTYRKCDGDTQTSAGCYQRGGAVSFFLLRLKTQRLKNITNLNKSVIINAMIAIEITEVIK